MYGYLCIMFIDYMFKNRSLLEVTNMFSPDDFKKKDEIVLNYIKYGF